jgi:hypothetical protein
MPLLRSSAQAAASVGCAGSGEECGFSWRLNSTTEQSDLGAQYSALEVIQGILVPVSKGLVTAASSSPSGTVPGNGSGASAPAKGSGERLAREQQNVVALVLLGLLAFVML